MIEGLGRNSVVAPLHSGGNSAILACKMNDVMQRQAQQKPLLLLGAILALLVVAGTLFDFVFGSLSGADLTALPRTAAGLLAELTAHPLLGLYHLDFLNLLLTLLTLPVYVALFMALRQERPGAALLALVLYAVGAAVFVSANAALPMLGLAGKHAAASDPLVQQRLIAAGEALLLRGEHGGYGMLVGSVLQCLANLAISVAQLRASNFRRWVGVIGLVGSGLLVVYLLLMALVPAAHTMAVALAAPGGLLILAWTLAVAVRLLRLAWAAPSLGLDSRRD
jgi:hypothetical protein